MGLYGIVDRRANIALNQIATCFHEKMMSTENHIPLIRGVRKIDASYFLQNKWMGRIYIYQWKVLIEGKKSKSTETIKLKYGNRGKTNFYSLQEQ